MISEFFNLRGRKSFFNRNFFIVLAIDVFLLGFSWVAAYLVRFDLDIPEKFVDEMVAILPVAILIKLLCLYFFDVYRGMWRFTSVRDLFGIIKAVSLSTLLIIVWVQSTVIRMSRGPSCLSIGAIILLISGVGWASGFFRNISQRIGLSTTAWEVTAGFPGLAQTADLGAGSCGEKQEQ
jgi:FlaA1/EpsC-like NDP-sugar epimerase